MVLDRTIELQEYIYEIVFNFCNTLLSSGRILVINKSNVINMQQKHHQYK